MTDIPAFSTDWLTSFTYLSHHWPRSRLPFQSSSSISHPLEILPVNAIELIGITESTEKPA